MNLEDLLNPWVEPHYSSRSICPVDLLLLIRYIERNNFKKIIEFGCGATTQEMRHKGFNIRTFSVGISTQVEDESLEFINCDISSPSNIEMVKRELSTADFLVIDALHTQSFAKFYSENYLSSFSGPVWIHDYFAKGITGEQGYLDRHVIGKTHRILIMSDMPDERLSFISNQIGYNLNDWKRSNVGTTKASLCSVILEKI